MCTGLVSDACVLHSIRAVVVWVDVLVVVVVVVVGSTGCMQEEKNGVDPRAAPVTQHCLCWEGRLRVCLVCLVKQIELRNIPIDQHCRLFFCSATAVVELVGFQIKPPDLPSTFASGAQPGTHRNSLILIMNRKAGSITIQEQPNSSSTPHAAHQNSSPRSRSMSLLPGCCHSTVGPLHRQNHALSGRAEL